ncbi:carbohydrate porin, partial [Escherichia coli]|uniref:carbohydrate porin n=3 Tax=Escherichia coli TaxID=562 RepID=UPI001FFF8E1C
DRNRSHWSTSKTPSYTKSVSWHHHLVCDNDCWIDDEGTYTIHTIHASYQFANVMDMENFNIYLGTYYSILDSDGDKKHGDDTDDRYGARVRFKYFF